MSKCTSKCPPKLYVATDIEIKLSLKEGILYTWDDADNFQIIFTLRNSNPLVQVTFSTVGGNITIEEATTLLIIPNTGITQAGVYDIKGKFIDKQGKIRGISFCPESLKFY